jgi:PAS domain S-box-containing protein
MTDQPNYEALVQKIGILEKASAKYKHVEKAFCLEEARLEALLSLNQMTGRPLQEITDFALEEAVRLTESEIGYLAFINRDETVLTMHSWSKNAMKQCGIINKPKVYPVETTGLWGEVVRQRKPIITNDYDAPNPLKKNYPKGHVKVTRHMNIPVFDGERVIAVAGVGNKGKEYDKSDVRQLKLLMQGMWRLILRKWTEWELRESEAKFRKLVQTVGCAIFIYQGNDIRFANPTSEVIFGYTQEDLLSKKFWEIIHPDYQEMAKQRGLARQRGEEAPARYEAKILRKNGEIGWCDFTLSLIEFEGKAAVLGIALDTTERKRTEEALEESGNKLRQLSSYLITAQEGERKRISFELHDELGQALTVLKLKLRSIERNLLDDQEKLRTDCENVLEDIDLIIENIRRLTRDLSPAVLEDLGLTAALRWMVDDFAGLYRNKVSLQIEDINHLFSPESQIIIYRIFQEALTNIGKHAFSTHVSVTTKRFNHSVSFMVEDNGRGFDTNKPLNTNPNEKGMGLAAMDERARMLGAQFNIQSRIGKGTTITVTVPMDMPINERKYGAVSNSSGR